MDFEFSDEIKRIRREVAEFVKKEATPEVIADANSRLGLGAKSWEFRRKVGEKRWIAPTLPLGYGGLGFSYSQRYALWDELAYQQVMPTQYTGAGIVAPVLMHYGTQEQKDRFLFPIARGEIEFALGYTEPQAGSDLAALEIRAVEDGNDYVISGQKLYNTACHFAQYHWLAARTDATGPKHKGISLFMVDMKTPGITLRPLWTLDGERTNEVFYDSVRVPKSNMVGEKDKALQFITTALTYERNFIYGAIRAPFEDLVKFVKTAQYGGKPLRDNRMILCELADLAIQLRIGELLSFRVAWMADRGLAPEWEAPMAKMWGTELMKRLGDVGTRILGLYGLLQEGSEEAPLNGVMDKLFRHGIRRCISGGTSEIMHNAIALRRLKLPRK